MDAKEQIQRLMRQRDISQVELAQRLKVTPQALSRALSKPPINSRSLWPQILEALNAEMVIKERDQAK